MENKLSKDKSCSGCEFYSAEGLKKLGVKTDNFDYVVALAGNPNTGKSTVFNTLTGLRQHTGNWPGKTVIRAEGAYSYDGKKYKVVDLPGTYSLLSTSTDEEIARNFILFGNPSVTVIVADASRLERNLNLILQTLEITNRAVLCLNLMDEAERNNIEINDRALARELGIPVVPTSARFGDGMPELLKTIHDMAEGKIICKPHRLKNVPEKISSAIEKLGDEIRSMYPNIPNYRWLALRLLEGDERIIEAFNSGELSTYGA